MRIAYVCADRGIKLDGAAGSSVHASQLMRAMTGEGAKLTAYLALGGDGGNVSDLPCPVYDIAGDSVLEQVRTWTAKAIRESDVDSTTAAEIYSLLLNQSLTASLEATAGEVDLVYERQSLWSVAALSFARRRGIPYFVEVNAPLTLQQREYRSLEFVEAAAAIERIILSSADLVLATSVALTDYAHDCGASRRATRVVPCGVSTDLFVDVVEGRERAVDQFVLGFVGSLKPWHGVEILLDAFRELHARYDGYRLLIVGDGPMRESIESFCREHALEQHVTLTGSVPHESIAEYLAQMDVGIAPYPPLPSFYFSPLKVWEYAAAGLPIVASACGDVAEVLPHKTAALLHPPGNVTKIVKHVEKLRTDPDLAVRLARRARRAVRARTWDRLAARILRLADSRIAATRGRSSR